jgi:hypothetical protein
MELEEFGIFKYLYFKNIISQTIDHNRYSKNSFNIKYNIEMVTLVIDKLSLLIQKYTFSFLTLTAKIKQYNR